MRRLLRDEGEFAPIADINMTNLVDVTLTLLILFILIAPVIDQGFMLRLPEAEGKDIRTVQSMTVTMSREGRISLEGQSVTLAELGVRASQMAVKTPDTDVVFMADRDVSYGRVVEAMNVVRVAGLSSLALATVEGAGES